MIALSSIESKTIFSLKKKKNKEIGRHLKKK